ncbi:MAG TPA: acyltransferase [Acidimicrobiales bacterium]|nr:acyltransferase [Acidimicrobiales bacterium]
MTGLRFLAALAVFANHAGDAFLDPENPVNGTAQTGFAGVSFFFVLSGFVLTWSARPGDRPAAFYRRRVARIVPNHAVAWLLALVVLLAAGHSVGLVPAVLSLTLLQSWHPSPDVHFAVNAVAWTLAVEAFFYATFPFLLPVLAHFGQRWRRALMGLSVSGTLLAAGAGYAAAPAARHWLVYVFPVARLPEFVLGILLALEVRAGATGRFRLAPALALAVAVWLACRAVPPAFQVAAVTLVPFALLIVAAAQADIAGRRSFARHRALVRLGEWSFAFYLLHAMVLEVADGAVDLRGRGPAFIVAGILTLLAVSVAASATLFSTVERPMERRLRAPRAMSTS